MQVVGPEYGLVELDVYDASQWHVEGDECRPAGDGGGGRFGGDEEEADVRQMEGPFGFAGGRGLRGGESAKREGEIDVIGGGQEALAGVPGGRSAGRAGIETHLWGGFEGRDGGKEEENECRVLIN